MPQSNAEAESLMEQQHGFNTSQGNFHEEEEEDNSEHEEWSEYVAELCTNCAHSRASHVNYDEGCCEADCDCLCFEGPE
jgi:hypothetical protein